MNLLNYKNILVKQLFEGAELFGFETRNRYQLKDEQGENIGFAAERQKGFWGFILRQVLGHWRKFDVFFYGQDKKEFLHAHHPFRWFFQRFEIKDPAGNQLGALQQRFSILNKKFDIEDAHGHVLYEMKSPIWRIWTFPFLYQGEQIACVKKKWSGLFAEAFTDKDTFLVSFEKEDLTQAERSVILATSVFIDLQYFEKKSGSH
jgi:uncharacterized protein YxjI